MKNFTFTLTLMLCVYCATAQIPQLQWANSMGGPSEADMGTRLIPDNNGNLFFYGRFSGTVDFDPGPGTANLTAGGNYDIFIGKYDSSGALLWIKNIGGSVIATYNGHMMNPYDATVDNAGNLFITGLYVGIVDIDPSAGSNLLYPYPSGPMGERIFVASYTNNGDFRWGFGYGYQDFLGGYWNSGYSIKIDHAGDVVVSGMYHGPCDFDPSPSDFTLTANLDYMDIFFAKYSNAGDFIWAKSIGGGGINDTPTDMLIDDNDNIYLCGYIDIEADFDPSAATATINSNGGGGDIFLAKYNSSGNYQWAFSAGSSANYDVAASLAMDIDGNICMGGYFFGTVDFDPGAAISNLTSAGTYADAFLSKYTSSGNFIWAKSFGGVNHENMGSMLIDQYGRIIISGDFWGSCDFDPSPLTELIDIAAAPNAAFIAQYDNDGNFLNVMPVYGTNSYLFNHGVVKDDHENMYFTGGLEGTADFDASATTYNLTATGTYQDIFMSKYKIGSAGISGRLWNDENSNGIPDPGELTGLANVKVELAYDRNNNNAIDPYDGIISTISQADGSYAFDFMAAGNYLLRVLPQQGYSGTTILLLDADLTIGQVISNKNFGFVSTLVPVACSDFSANQLNDEITVQWKTSTEVNTRGFNLQRSLDGISFENIAWINAQGNTSGSFNYRYSDKDISTGANYYYRLQETDLAGNEKYICGIQLVKYRSQKEQVSIYPNPVREYLHVLLNAAYDQLIITDISGRKMKEFLIDTNTRSLDISVKEFLPGIYFLKLTGKNGKLSTKMMKL